jgi:hypothetical protein
MTFNDKFADVREAFIDGVGAAIKQIAALFGYPENPGMKITGVPLTAIEDIITDKRKLVDSLPLRKVPFPPMQRPETFTEMLFGTIPKVEPIPRTIYESTQDGYYNFYIENYRNIFFLPNWLSEFLQIRLNYCLDITYLEVFREIMFLVIFGYAQLVSLRIALSWFISINPYTVPWIYLVAMIDWTEEAMMGVVPTIAGLNLTGTIVSILLGRFADSMNHLVFTMPFLPSEGQPAKALINEELRDVLVFRYLPILWYRYPIPNEIREYWYQERPEILKYMQKAYQDLDIQFLPDRVVEELNRSQVKEGLSQLTEQPLLPTQEHVSTQVLAMTPFESVSELPNYLSSFTDGIYHSVLQYLEKLG